MENKIGALWRKNNFMSGVIKIDDKELRIVVFENTKKSKDTQPDYNILIARPRPVDSIKAPEDKNDIPF